MYDVYFPAKVCVGRNSIKWFGYESWVKEPLSRSLFLEKVVWHGNSGKITIHDYFCVLFASYLYLNTCLALKMKDISWKHYLLTYVYIYVHSSTNYDTILNFHKNFSLTWNNSWKIFLEINILQLGFTKKYEMGHSVEKGEILFQWIFRQSNSLVTSLVKTLHSRNQFEKRENFCNFHAVWG